MLVRALMVHFGTMAYNDCLDVLTRLKQTTTMAAYTADFEAASNRVHGFSDHHRLSCFISGINDEIWLPLRMFNPHNLTIAYGLEWIQEECLTSLKKTTKFSMENRSFSLALFHRNPGQSSENSFINQKYNPLLRRFS